MRVIFRIVLTLIALPFLLALMLFWALRGGRRASSEAERSEYNSPAKVSSD